MSKAIPAWAIERNRRHAELPPMPTAVSQRTGCKVSWQSYSTMDEAKIAARHAEIDAEYAAEQGYDFGYCTPGNITPKDDGTFEVTFP